MLMFEYYNIHFRHKALKNENYLAKKQLLKYSEGRQQSDGLNFLDVMKLKQKKNSTLMISKL